MEMARQEESPVETRIVAIACPNQKSGATAGSQETSEMRIARPMAKNIGGRKPKFTMLPRVCSDAIMVSAAVTISCGSAQAGMLLLFALPKTAFSWSLPIRESSAPPA